MFRSVLITLSAAFLFGAVFPGTAEAGKKLVRKDPCQRLDLADVPRNDDLLRGVSMFNNGDYDGASEAFTSAAGQSGLARSEMLYLEYGQAILMSRKGKGHDAIKGLSKSVKKLKTKDRCMLKAMLESQPWIMNIGDVFSYNKKALRKLAKKKKEAFASRAKSFELLGKFYFSMRARPPFLNLKISFDSFNAIRKKLSGKQRKMVQKISDQLDQQQSQLFADAPSLDLVE